MKVLSIELSDQSIRTIFIENDQQKVVEEDFTDRQEHRIKEQLREFFDKTGLKLAHFDEHLVSWSAQKSTLIPSNVFSESTPDDLYRLCFGKPLDSGTIDYNRIPEHGIVNLYHLPSWVKSFFVLNFPRSIIYHTLFVLQQKELMDEQLRIEICNGVGMERGICDEVILILNKIASLQATEISYSGELIQKSILLCV